MGDLFADYENDFAVLSADIVAKTNKTPNVHGEEKRILINEVEQKFDDAQELLEQMDLEVRGMSGETKAKFGTKLKSYKDEIRNLDVNFKKAKIALTDYEHARSKLMSGEDGAHSEDQRSRLLENNERLERTNRRLDEGYKVCIETEEIGEEILTNLGRDRETMTKTRDRLRNTNADLTKSSRILTTMMKRVVQNRILLFFVCLCIISVICVVIYYAAKKNP